MSSIWEKQLNLIVPYFVRIHFQNGSDGIEFPLDLKREIQKFASRRVGIWYSNIIGPDIYIIGDRLAKWTRTNDTFGWRTAYSTYTCNVEKGESIEWSLRLLTDVTSSFYISIIKDDDELLNEKAAFDSWGIRDNDKYIYGASYGYSRLASDNSVPFPGHEFKNEGDTLVIILDEDRKVSMKFNDGHCGSAPNFTLKPDNYRLAVHFWGQSLDIEFF